MNSSHSPLWEGIQLLDFFFTPTEKVIDAIIVELEEFKLFSMRIMAKDSV